MIRGMVTLDEVARLAEALPEVSVGARWGNRTWLVDGKGFAWERPFSKADVKRFGEAKPPEGPILAVRVADLGEKEAVLATSSSAFFNIAHFNGYPAVLIQLDAATEQEVREALIDAWLACAPEPLAEAFLASPPVRHSGLR